MTMAITDETAPVAKGPSMVVQIVILLVLTLLALGLGWGAGMYMRKGADAVAPEAPAATPVTDAEDTKKDDHAAAEPEAGKEGEKPAPGAPIVIALEPMTTNLAAPTKTWVRLEASVVFHSPPTAGMADIVHQDILAYMRNVKLHQIEGPSGFQHLRADLDQRASIRSDGQITQVLIRTLLFE